MLAIMSLLIFQVQTQRQKGTQAIVAVQSCISVAQQLHLQRERALQGKKTFLPLPSLEAVQHKLPWRLNFSQKLGRHAIARHNILAGQCIFAEQAVQAVPTQVQERSACHTCLKPLPEGGDEMQLAQGVILDKASKHYKRYCSVACSQADCTASSTASLHSRVPQIAAENKCDPTLMHFILELDAQRQRQPSNHVDASDNQQSSSGAASVSTEVAQKDPVDLITCTLADVEALLSPFDQNQKGWRDAITAGELYATQGLQWVILPYPHVQ